MRLGNLKFKRVVPLLCIYILSWALLIANVYRESLANLWPAKEISHLASGGLGINIFTPLEKVHLVRNYFLTGQADFNRWLSSSKADGGFPAQGGIPLQREMPPLAQTIRELRSLMGFTGGYAFAFSEEGWNVEKSTHFIVYFKAADEKFVRQLIEKSEGYYSSIADELGFNRYDFWTWDKRAKVYIYNDAEDYRKHTGKPAWSGGNAYYSEKVIETYPWATGFFDSLLPHELGHIIFREFVGGASNAPSWLDEGVAMYHEKLRRFDTKKELLKAIDENRLIPLSKLSSMNIAFIGDQELVRLYYVEASSVVDYLINEFGRDNFVKFCHALRERKTFDEAINKGYSVFTNLEELNKGWVRYIKE